MTATDHLKPGTVFERAATQVRAVDAAARTFTAIGVPYGQRIETPFWSEEFAEGSVQGGDRALILWCHRDHEVLGKVTNYRDTPDGFEITAQLSDTDRGREAYTLLTDGVIDRMSIGFQAQEYRVEAAEDGTETVIHTKVRALEFSLVPFPAYDGAEVLAVRSLARNTPPDSPEETPVMTETLTRADVDSALEPAFEKLSLLERSIATARTSGNAEVDEATALARRFRSVGEFAQGVARGDENATKLHRAAEGNLASEIPSGLNSTFLGNQIRFVDERRDTVNMFDRGVIPAKGMNVDYAKVDHDASVRAVAKQATELAKLAGPNQIKFKTASAPVETYGGYTTLSRQAIERADVPYLDSVLRIMTLEYARVTEAAVQSRVLTELDALLAADGGIGLGATAAAGTISDWAGVIVDAGQEFRTRGFKSAGLAVSPDIFKTLATQTATDGRPLMNLTGTGVNVSGTANLMDAQGELLRVPVKVLTGTTGRAFFWDPIAVKVLESAAPILLQQEDITVLGKDFSIYGYQAITVPFVDALLPVEFAAA